jgi:hypothetical protein
MTPYVRPMRRFVPAHAAIPAPPTAASARLAMFVVAQVRHALQQTAAMGACSPYFVVVCTTRLVQICFIRQL